MEQNTINIYRNRKHLTIAVLGSIGFVCLGVFMYMRADIWPAAVGHTIALAAILFFGACALVGSYFLFFKKKEPIVILAPAGITLHNGDGSSYTIAWHQITGLEVVQWLGEAVLTIGVADSQRAIEAEPNLLYRKSLEFNNKNFKTPYCIILRTVDYPKGALLPLMLRYRDHFGKPETR